MPKTKKQNLTRRDFLKVSTLGVSSLVAGSRLLRIGRHFNEDGFPTFQPRPSREFVTTTCMQCMNQCGIIARVENNRVVKLDGAPQHPTNLGRMCAKGQAGIQKLYDPERLFTPLRRIGKRGENKWESISWNEALNEITTRLQQVRQQYGKHTLAYLKNTDYEAVDLTKRFCYAYGTPNFIEHGSNCTASYYIGMVTTLGPWAVRADISNARNIMLFGTNPLAAFDLVKGVRNLYAAKEAGASLVVVDPRFTETASKANEWIPIIPGTDGALILGMIHTIINESLFDREFVSRYTLGFEKLRHFVQPYTPEWAAGVSDVLPDTTRRLARQFATRKPSVAEGQRGLAAHTNGLFTSQALAILNALVGSIDTPGGLLLYPFPALGPVEPEPPLPNKARLDRATVDRLPPLVGPQGDFPVSGSGIFASLANSILTEEPYPTKALILDGTSPVYALPDIARQEAALKKVDFVLSLDAFMGESTVLADIVLPVTTYLETWDVACRNYGSPETIGLRRPVVEPIGDSRPTAEIIIELARRLELDYFDFDYREYVAEGLKNWEVTLEGLEKQGFAQRPLKIGEKRREGFGTPSGKVELYSTLLSNAGYDGLPVFERPRGHTIEIASEFPLFLITPKLNVHTQSRTAGNPYLNEIIGENWVEINTETAAALGIANGDMVWVESQNGSIRLRAKVGPHIHPRTLAIPHHFGHTAYNRRAKDKGANPNRIISLDWDRVGGNTAANDTMVRVRK